MVAKDDDNAQNDEDDDVGSIRDGCVDDGCSSGNSDGIDNTDWHEGDGGTCSVDEEALITDYE